MKRTDIIEAAKQLVLQHGPANVLEFGSELLLQTMVDDEEGYEPVLREAYIQAGRVYSFLGYDPPAHFANMIANARALPLIDVLRRD